MTGNVEQGQYMCQAMWSKASTCDRQCGARPVHVTGDVEQGSSTPCHFMQTPCPCYLSVHGAANEERGAWSTLGTDKVDQSRHLRLIMWSKVDTWN